MRSWVRKAANGGARESGERLLESHGPADREEAIAPALLGRLDGDPMQRADLGPTAAQSLDRGGALGFERKETRNTDLDELPYKIP